MKNNIRHIAIIIILCMTTLVRSASCIQLANAAEYSQESYLYAAKQGRVFEKKLKKVPRTTTTPATMTDIPMPTPEPTVKETTELTKPQDLVKAYDEGYEFIKLDNGKFIQTSIGSQYADSIFIDNNGDKTTVSCALIDITAHGILFIVEGSFSLRPVNNEYTPAKFDPKLVPCLVFKDDTWYNGDTANEIGAEDAFRIDFESSEPGNYSCSAWFKYPTDIKFEAFDIYLVCHGNKTVYYTHYAS